MTVLPTFHAALACALLALVAAIAFQPRSVEAGVIGSPGEPASARSKEVVHATATSYIFGGQSEHWSRQAA